MRASALLPPRFAHFAPETSTSTTATLSGSSRFGWRGGRMQDGDDPRPEALLAPAAIPAVDRLPGTELGGHLAPRGAGTGNPENAFEDRAMVAGRSPLRGFLRRQQGEDPLPALVGEGDRLRQVDDARLEPRRRGSVAGATSHVSAPRARLMGAPPRRPAQAPLSFGAIRDAHHPKQPADLGHGEGETLGSASPFPVVPALLRSRVTSRKAWARSARVMCRRQASQRRTSY